MDTHMIAACQSAEDIESHPSRSTGVALSEQINHRLRRAHQRANGIFLETVGNAEVTPTQWAALATLEIHGTLSQNQLGRLTYMDPATTQGVILRLVERALVARSPDPLDRRRTSVRLTPAGQSLVARLKGEVAAAHTRALKPLDEQERRQFLDLLERLM